MYTKNSISYIPNIPKSIQIHWLPVSRLSIPDFSILFVELPKDYEHSPKELGWPEVRQTEELVSASARWHNSRVMWSGWSFEDEDVVVCVFVLYMFVLVSIEIMDIF